MHPGRKPERFKNIPKRSFLFFAPRGSEEKLAVVRPPRSLMLAPDGAAGLSCHALQRRAAAPGENYSKIVV